MTETNQHTFQHIPTSHNADFGAIWDERRRTLLRDQDQKPHRPAKRSFHVHKTRPIVPHVTLTSVVAVDIPPPYLASPCLHHPLPIPKDFVQHPMTRSSRKFYPYILFTDTYPKLHEVVQGLGEVPCTLHLPSSINVSQSPLSLGPLRLSWLHGILW